MSFKLVCRAVQRASDALQTRDRYGTNRSRVCSAYFVLPARDTSQYAFSA